MKQDMKDALCAQIEKMPSFIATTNDEADGEFRHEYVAAPLFGGWVVMCTFENHIDRDTEFYVVERSDAKGGPRWLLRTATEDEDAALRHLDQEVEEFGELPGATFLVERRADNTVWRTR
jgi:hypothetical protein